MDEGEGTRTSRVNPLSEWAWRVVGVIWSSREVVFFPPIANRLKEPIPIPMDDPNRNEMDDPTSTPNLDSVDLSAGM